MWPAALAQALAAALQHETLRDRDCAKRRDIVAGQHAGIDVRQQPRLLEDEPRRLGEIADRRLVAEGAELLASDLVAQLRLVAEREQRFLAPGRRAGARDREHLLSREKGALAP